METHEGHDGGKYEHGDSAGAGAGAGVTVGARTTLDMKLVAKIPDMIAVVLSTMNQ